MPAAGWSVCLLVVLTSCWFTTGEGNEDEELRDRSLSERPFVPLMTETNDCDEVTRILAADDTAHRALDDLTTWYVHFHNETSNAWPFGVDCRPDASDTLAARLVARGAWVSNYRNGSYVSQASPGDVNFLEAAALEREAPLAIGTFWPADHDPTRVSQSPAGARLTGSVDAASVTISIDPVPRADRPVGTSSTWPFLASRGSGLGPAAHSESTQDFVSWIRIEHELMQVIDEPRASRGTIALRVRRGLWGTDPAGHDEGARVFAPAYVGSTAAAPGDRGYSGIPARNDPRAPLRYVVEFWEPAGSAWIADRIEATFGPSLQGYDTVWLDISGCRPYNTAAATGEPIAPWNDAAGSKQTPTTWGEGQREKLRTLRNRFPGVRFVGNNLGSGDPCDDGLLAAGFDAGAIEGFMGSRGGAAWEAHLDLAIRAMSHDWPAIFWSRWAAPRSEDPERSQRFAYGVVLLALRSEADRFQFGGPFGLRRPPDLFFWDWGDPLQASPDVTDLQVGGGLLGRRFERGLILVNPTDTPIVHDLGGTYLDVSDATTESPVPRSTVTVPPRDGAFLLARDG